MTPVLLFLAAAAAPTLEIKVDQVGYLPEAAKVAFVVSKAAATSFRVRRTGDDAVAFEGTLAPPVADGDSGDAVRAADFSGLRREGSYLLDVPGVGRSFAFAIGPDVFVRPFVLALRSYYGQRCGTAVDFKHPHHRPSGADDQPEPWPGLLSGGPNRSRQDAAMQKLPDLPPARMYVDDEASYASNENAINWNAPLVFLLAGALPPE